MRAAPEGEGGYADSVPPVSIIPPRHFSLLGTAGSQLVSAPQPPTKPSYKQPTMFTVKAEYAGETRKILFPYFPSWGALIEQASASAPCVLYAPSDAFLFLLSQVYKVFRVDQYYLSNLLLSSETQGEDKILIATEIHTPVEYIQHVSPFMKNYGHDGVLRFSVQDKVHRKEPSSSSSRSARSQAPMEVDDRGEPFNRTPRFSLSMKRRLHPHYPPRGPRHRYYTGDDSTYSDRSSRSRVFGRHKSLFPHLPHIHPRMQSEEVRNSMPIDEDESMLEGETQRRWKTIEELERIWSDPPNRSRSPYQGILNLSSPSTHNPSSESSASEEVSQLIQSFVSEINDVLAKHGMGEHSLSVTGESDAARSATTPVVAPKVEDKFLHPGYHCDYCLSTIRGTRFKASGFPASSSCTNCHDFDLCENCVKVHFAKLDHDPYHHFMEIPAPGTETPIPSTPVVPAPEEPARHAASCDLCNATIYGVRHKCRNCLDYDMCSECFENHRGEHSFEHEFGSYATPEEVVLLHYPIEAPVPSPPAVQPSANYLLTPNIQHEPVHAATCDKCFGTVVGIRHKCLDCEDYDLCNECFPGNSLLHFNGTHRFLHLDEPKRIVVTRVYDDDPSPVNEEGQSATLPEDSHVQHNARCDFCGRIILGFRHKCLDCEDFDLCNSCKTNAREAHDMSHTFVKFNTPGEVVVYRRPEPAATTVPPLSAPPVPPAPSDQPQDPTVVHNAMCDLCDSRVVGDRYKCTRCPDFDVCRACFPLSPEEHPYHAFVKVSRPEQIMTPIVEQYTTVHPANCDVCHNHIIGIRFKCLHPDCPDFDLCQHCEALPISVHPTNHPLAKFKDDYTINESRFERVFEFIRTTALKDTVDTMIPSGPSPLLPPLLALGIESPPLPSLPALGIDGLIPRAESPQEEGLLFPRVPQVERLLLLEETEEMKMRDGATGITVVRSPHETPETENPFADPILETERTTTVEVTAPQIMTYEETGLDSPARVMTPILGGKPLSPRSISLQASYIADNNVDDGHVFPPGAEFVKSWLMSNPGAVPWPETTQLVFVGGDRLSSGDVANNAYHVGRVEPGAEVDVHAHDMKAPEEPGRYVSHWRLSDGEGKLFGDQLWCDINVEQIHSSLPSSMSSSSVIRMPSAAPQDEVPANQTEERYPTPNEVRSPGTLLSSVGTATISSASGLSDSGDSDWEDARAMPAPRRRDSNEFIFVDEDDADGDGH
ncbi:uncharacterized protein EI90DRAFT_3152608 [Cantharellus anzutake]|uniref:uncharacterized protein n=1 Tax=Cantharellus anzutake TaxID=1750568 RepID=UPI0019055AFD|nr:uncharacterized protein EI90DRAFT_3152608 [Cantharellus anzutake]KAF8336445.1 hypothetical protein EI90DRAFT_3152608 [Cantharellus anzutake]